MTSETKSQSIRPRARVGQVVSVSGPKTVSVAINTLVRHAQYGKYLRRRTKLAVHDETGQARIGDVVEIVPCRRLSKNKAHRLARVVRSAPRAQN